jgi:hypothetical protein
LTDLFTGDGGGKAPAEKQAGNRGKGRPKGARGKVDPSLRDYVAARYGETPGQTLARKTYMPPDQYAREVFICKPDEVPTRKQLQQAAQRQERHLYTLLGFTEKKMPTEIAVTDEKTVVLQIGQVTRPSDASKPVTGRTIELVPANVRKTKQNQQLRTLDDEASDIEPSDKDS